MNITERDYYNYHESRKGGRKMLPIIAILAGSLVLTACNHQIHSHGVSPHSEVTTQAEANPEKPELIRYPKHEVVASVFHIGEKASNDNAWIDNISTEWESDARIAFGGTDDPLKRMPKGLPDLTPKENPFYVALPASEYDDNGPIDAARKASPWADEEKDLPTDDSRSLFKGRWVEVSIPGAEKKVYGQWLDTGPSDDPNATRDYGYVFGQQKPKNSYGLKAGIDLSPAMAAQLGFGIEEGSAKVVWRFVDKQDVPEGLWTKYPAITNATHWD